VTEARITKASSATVTLLNYAYTLLGEEEEENRHITTNTQVTRKVVKRKDQNSTLSNGRDSGDSSSGGNTRATSATSSRSKGPSSWGGDVRLSHDHRPIGGQMRKESIPDIGSEVGSEGSYPFLHEIESQLDQRSDVDGETEGGYSLTEGGGTTEYSEDNQSYITEFTAQDPEYGVMDDDQGLDGDGDLVGDIPWLRPRPISAINTRSSQQVQRYMDFSYTTILNPNSNQHQQADVSDSADTFPSSRYPAASIGLAG